jgi:hypothetical protein
MDKADETKIYAELAFLESIRERVLEALEAYSERRYSLFIEIAKRLSKEYNQEYSHVNELIGFNSYFKFELEVKI